MSNSFTSQRAFGPVPNHLIGQLTAIYEFKGKEKLYQVQAPEILAALQTSAIIESTESSNRIEGVVASPERVRQIVGKGAAPSNRSEAEIAGYRDVLGQIHASHAFMPVTPNIVLQLHRDMFKYTSARAGVWKPVDNTIEARTSEGEKEVVFVPVSAFAAPTAMDELCSDFARASAAGTADPLLATGAFVLDFLCIHPFLDGNGRLPSNGEAGFGRASRRRRDRDREARPQRDVAKGLSFAKARCSLDSHPQRRTLLEPLDEVAALSPNPRRRGTGEPTKDGLPPSGVNPARSW